MSVESNLRTYANNNLNVLLIGNHGIGKSTVVFKIKEELNLKFKYYSSSTLDPYAELIGIPVPDKDKKIIEFYRGEDIQDAEFIFFDELNRAHPRVLNTVLEIIQFKSINGEPLPNLKMVWAAINPPGDDYQVEELDPALVDRFHAYVKMKARIDTKYFESKMSPPIVKAVKGWWEALSRDQKKIFTPRRLEYIGMMIENNIPWSDALPQGHPWDRKGLEERIRIARGGLEGFAIDKETVLEYKDKIVERLQTDKREMPKLAEIMRRFNPPELFECRDIIELFPRELLRKLADHKWPGVRNAVKDVYVQNKVEKSYPRTMEAFSSTKPTTDDN